MTLYASQAAVEYIRGWIMLQVSARVNITSLDEQNIKFLDQLRDGKTIGTLIHENSHYPEEELTNFLDVLRKERIIYFKIDDFVN